MTDLDLTALRERIGLRDLEAASDTRLRLDGLVKPVGSLGRLEQLAIWLSGVQGASPPRPLDDVRVVVFAGDHGIARSGVSAYPPEVTAAMVRTFVAGGAGVNALARLHGASVRVLDLGVDGDLSDLPPEVTAHKVCRGSGSIDVEDALSDDEVTSAFRVGQQVADEEVDGGADLLIAGDMGIGNTTVAAALVAVLLQLDPLDVVGTGTGIDDDAWARKVGALRDACYRARPVRDDPIAVLRTVGSADTAAMTGFLVQAAARRTPVLLDGVVACAAAMAARRVADTSSHWWVAGHRSTEPSQHRVLDALGLDPLLDLGMRLGEGTGALTALPVLRAAQAMCAEMALLADLLPPTDVEPGRAPSLDVDAT